MEFSTTAGLLRDTLTIARHATPTHPSMTAFAGVFLEVKADELSMTGSDGETTISASLPLSGAKKGQVLVLPKPLSNFLSNLDADETVTVRLNATEDLEVQPEGGNSYSFRRVVATFPALPNPKTAPKAVDLSRLDQALSAIRASTARDTPGVQLVSSEAGLTLHSTDNYRLSRAVLPEAGFGDFAGVVPLGILERISRMNVNQVTVDPKGRTLRFAGPEVIVTTRLLSTAFPDVGGILDSTPPSEAVISVPKLRRALPRLNSVAEQAPLKVRFEDNVMTLSVSNADLGAGSESVDLETDVVAPFEFFVKLSFLLDMCTSHDSETVKLAYSAPLEPLFSRSSDPIEVTSVLMPVKV